MTVLAFIDVTVASLFWGVEPRSLIINLVEDLGTTTFPLPLAMLVPYFVSRDLEAIVCEGIVA